MEREHKTDGTPCWCNPKVIKVKAKKYTVKEVFDSLYWTKDDYWLVLGSDINGCVKKIPLHHILLEEPDNDD